MRDISKAFDKVWHKGLKYKILNINLPPLTEKLICSFLDDRTAKIKLKSALSDIITMHCGVPQGAIKSPTLFTIYTHDSPASTTGTNITYADDITQISHYEGKSKNIAALRTKREIEKINEYEDIWKIKTNIHKFKIIQLGARNKVPIQINNNMNHGADDGRILGLKISTQGYIKHITERKNLAKIALGKLYRFREFNTKIKTHLVKAFVLPILEYPPIPIHTMSTTQIKRLQKMQNKALRFATNQRHPYTMTNEQIHEYTKTPALNIRVHQQAQKIWQKLHSREDVTLNEIVERQAEIPNIRFNYWFKSSLQIINNNEDPAPIY